MHECIKYEQFSHRENLFFSIEQSKLFIALFAVEDCLNLIHAEDLSVYFVKVIIVTHVFLVCLLWEGGLKEP
jgi:hypothetical protein